MKSWILNHLNAIFVSIVAIITPVQPLMLTVGFLIVVDFIFAIYRAYKTGEAITSRKMGNTIPKIILYNISILSLYLVNKYVINSGLPLEKIAAGLISIVEIKSCDESFKIIYGWSLWDKVKKIISRGKSTTKDLLD